VWLRATCKPDGYEYYEYIRVFADDTLAISHLLGFIMETIKMPIG